MPFAHGILLARLNTGGRYGEIIVKIYFSNAIDLRKSFFRKGNARSGIQWATVQVQALSPLPEAVRRSYLVYVHRAWGGFFMLERYFASRLRMERNYN